MNTKNELNNRKNLKAENVDYFATSFVNGMISKIPRVEVEDQTSIYIKKTTSAEGKEVDIISDKIDPNMINLVLYDKKSGKKIEAIDELISPLSKYSHDDSGGVFGF